MNFFSSLIRYEVTLWNTLDAALHRAGLISLAQLQAVEIIDRLDQRARVNDISDEIGITVGAASKLVDRLERDGLAERRPNPGDRRSSLVSLSEAGNRALRQARDVRDSGLRALVPDDDAAAARAILERLQRKVDAAASPEEARA